MAIRRTQKRFSSRIVAKPGRLGRKTSKCNPNHCNPTPPGQTKHDRD